MTMSTSGLASSNSASNSAITPLRDAAANTFTAVFSGSLLPHAANDTDMTIANVSEISFFIIFFLLFLNLLFSKAAVWECAYAAAQTQASFSKAFDIFFMYYLSCHYPGKYEIEYRPL